MKRNLTIDEQEMIFKGLVQAGYQSEDDRKNLDPETSVLYDQRFVNINESTGNFALFLGDGLDILVAGLFKRGKTSTEGLNNTVYSEAVILGVIESPDSTIMETMTDAGIITLDERKKFLADLYVKVIGYDPFADDPSRTPDEVAQTLRTFAQEAITHDSTQANRPEIKACLKL